MMNILAAGGNPVLHVIDKDIAIFPEIGGYAITNASVMLVLAGLLTILIMLPAAKRIATGKAGTLEDLQTRGTWANLVEAVCMYMRDDVFRPVLGAETDKYTPMLWTMFWFILINNLLGLVPIGDVTNIFLAESNHHGIGGTATQSIFVTGALATVAFVWFNGCCDYEESFRVLETLDSWCSYFHVANYGSC